MNRENVQKHMENIRKMLEQYANENNLKFEKGAGKYNYFSFCNTHRFLESDKSESIHEDEWKTIAPYFGLSPSTYKKTFTANGQVFRAEKLSTRAKRFPLKARNVESGEMFKFVLSENIKKQLSDEQ